MTTRRQAARRDLNEPDIIRALREVGASVVQLSEPGVPDLLIGFQGRNWLAEVKGEPGPRGGVKGRTLTADQITFARDWMGQLGVVRNPREALELIGLYVEG